MPCCLHPLALTSDPDLASTPASATTTTTSTSTSTSPRFYHPLPCPWQVRTLPDANMLWRHQLVESDIRQHYRKPDALITA